MNVTPNDTRPLTTRPTATSCEALAAWAEAMVNADVTAQVELGVFPCDAVELRRNVAVALLECIADHLGLRIAAVADAHDKAAA